MTDDPDRSGAGSDGRRRDVLGAGRSGGLLFLGVVAFFGWLVATETNGLLRVVLLVLVAVAVTALGADVIRRR